MEENAYQLLGLEQGPESTEAEIKKAYRKLALAKHPDKNPDNPRAADEFSALQKAYELLTDKEARAALDALLKAKAARVERVAVHDEKRRRMMEELERRERGWEAARSQEETARAKLRAEMDRLRREAAERQAKKAAEQRQAAQQAAAAAAGATPAATSGQQGVAASGQQQGGMATAAAGPATGAAGVAAPGDLSDEMRERLSRTLKVSWSRKDGEYGTAELRRIFAAHGGVEDVVLREGKKRKGSALVVMADNGGAAAAAAAVNGHLANPLLVVPFNKAAGAGAGPGEEESEAAAPGPAAAAGAGPAGGGPAGPAAAAATGAVDARPVESVFPTAAARMRHAASAPAFAAGAAAGGAAPALPPHPTAPLFAAGARPGSAGGSAAALFPGAPSSAAAAAVPARQPLFAAAAGSASQPPAPGQQQAVPAAGGAASGPGAASNGSSSVDGGTAAPTFPGGTAFESFSSFRRPPAPSGAGAASSLHALNGGLEGATLAKMRQAAERRRLIEEMEREDS